MSLKKYLFENYPPAVTSVLCTSCFALYLLCSAVFYEFANAPDHSMPADYNRLLHNLSRYDLCQTPEFTPPDTANFPVVSLLTFVHGSSEFVRPDSTLHVLINSPDGPYVVRSDARQVSPACEDGRCKVEKCVEIRAPADLFPQYNISKSLECTMEEGIDDKTTNFTLCEKHPDTQVQLKFDFKRRNRYAKNLPENRKILMQNKLLFVGFSLLAFNLVVFLIVLWNARFYHGFSLTIQ